MGQFLLAVFKDRTDDQCGRGVASVRASRGQVVSETGRGRATQGLEDRGEVV